MKKNNILLKALYFIVIISFSSVLYAQKSQADRNARPSTSGKLHVAGTEIHDQNDKAVVLRGVSTHGLTWYPKFVNRNLFKQISSEWNANFIRLAMYSEDYVNGNKKKNLEILHNGIAYAIESNMYVLVDWHILNDNNPNQNLSEAVAFFNQIAKEYASVPNVIYEICNEPNGDCTWADIKEYAAIIIPIIRRHNPDAMIMVGTPDYDRDIESPAKDPLDFDNVMYSFHFYTSSHGYDMQEKLCQIVEGGTPVFITECGISEASGNGRINFSRAKNWFNQIDYMNLSYAVWSLSNKEEESAMIKDTSHATEYLTDKDLSLCGQFVRTLLRGEDINQFFFEYGTYSHLRLLWSTEPALIWVNFCHFQKILM